MQAAVAAARAAHIATYARWGSLGTLYEPMQSIIAWNTIVTPYEYSPVTPVSRGWDFGAGYVIFDWDNLFLALMASLEDGVSRDIAYSNLIQILLARTVDGFVPNYASGRYKSYDRSEPQVGAVVALRIFNKWGDAWVVDLVFDALASWNDWVWRRRRGAAGVAGNLVVLGSDPSTPPGDSAANTLQGARYESGLDNSPMYDAPPVAFDNATSHQMALYDVGMTALYLSDTKALMQLATATGRGGAVPALQQRFDAVASELQAYLWDAEAGIYSNALLNGSFYARYSPTSLFPMLAGVPSAQQAYGDDLPPVTAARKALVAPGRQLVERNWGLFGHVNENYNGYTGLGETGDSDPFYTWGALAGFISFLEGGVY